MKNIILNKQPKNKTTKNQNEKNKKDLAAKTAKYMIFFGLDIASYIGLMKIVKRPMAKFLSGTAHSFVTLAIESVLADDVAKALRRRHSEKISNEELEALIDEIENLPDDALEKILNAIKEKGVNDNDDDIIDLD